MKTHASDSSSDTRQRLLQAALVIFADKGFEGAGIREIAERAKANSAMVQYYFGGKEGLYQAALEFLLDSGPRTVESLAPPPQPGDPEARTLALRSLHAYVRAFLGDLCCCGGSREGQDQEGWNREFHSAAHLFWSRELQNPHPDRVDLIRSHIERHVRHVDACLKVLCPELDREGLLRMNACIQAQVLFYHRDMSIIELLRGEAYGEADMDSLARHITLFSLRGLGVPGSDIEQTLKGVDA